MSADVQSAHALPSQPGVPGSKIRSVLWIALVSASLSVGGSITILGHLTNAVRNFTTDWLIFWFTAQTRVTAIYVNFEHLPFPYPPPAIMFLRPFGLLPVWWSLALWSVLGIAAIFLASRSFVRPVPFLIAMLMPASVYCLINGQTALFIGALVMAGLRHPALWGLGCVIKPHSFVALPFTGRWKSLAVAAMMAAIVVLLSAAVFGPAAWVRWFYFLDDFRTAVIARGVSDFAIGPLYFARAILGAVVTIVAFRNSDVMLDRYAALASGSILLSPYSLEYDLAGLSIAAAAMLFDSNASLFRWFAAAWLLSGLLPTAATVAMAAVIGIELGFRGRNPGLSAKLSSA